ncbi:MAG: hypothetical protein LUQ16_03795 [Methanomassiliicoccales archaeon]|nr:hypothetical protein [Methanomassiliicoccales archaeon]
MRCPNCGYPNEERASTCFSCDMTIEGSHFTQKKPIQYLTIEPERRSSLATFVNIVKEGWGGWLVPVALLAASAFLPWAYTCYKNIDRLTIDHVVGANLFELLMADDVVIASLAAIFVMSFFIALLFPRLVIVSIGSLALLMYTMPGYMRSLPTNPVDEFLISYEIGVGFLLAWFSVGALGVLCFKDYEFRFHRGPGKDRLPSEVDDSSTNMDSSRRTV